MPFAIVHFLSTAAIMKLTGLRLDRGRFLSARELFVCAFIGILPDIDLVVQYFGRFIGVVDWWKNPAFWPHRLFTHNMIIPIILLVIGLLLYRKGVNRHASTVFFLASIAWGVHVLFDYIFMGPIRLFAPLIWTNIPSLLGWRTVGIAKVFIAVDAVLLVSWLFIRMLRRNV